MTRHAGERAASAIAEAMAAENWGPELAGPIAAELAPVHADGITAGYEQVKNEIAPLPPASSVPPRAEVPAEGGVVPREEARLGYSLDQVNERAVAWAREHAAALVRQISENTRSMIRQAVVDAQLEGVNGSAGLAERLEASPGFSPGRAVRIARTEIINSSTAGNLAGYEASGVVWGKEWLVGIGACVVCLANAAEGPIPLRQAFLSGDQAPTAHPHCRCAIAPILSPPAGHNAARAA